MPVAETITPTQELPPQELIDQLELMAEQIDIPLEATVDDAREILERFDLPRLLSEIVEAYGKIKERDFLYQKAIFGYQPEDRDQLRPVLFASVYSKRQDDQELPKGFHAFKTDPERQLPIMHLDIPLNPDHSLDHSRPLWRVDGVTATSYLETLKRVLVEMATGLAQSL
jgi:hypothetical protein